MKNAAKLTKTQAVAALAEVAQEMESKGIKCSCCHRSLYAPFSFDNGKGGCVARVHDNMMSQSPSYRERVKRFEATRLTGMRAANEDDSVTVSNWLPRFTAIQNALGVK